MEALTPPWSNEMVKYLRNYRFVSQTVQRQGQDMPSFAERMITAGLDDITLSGAVRPLVYEFESGNMRSAQVTPTEFRQRGYSVDHVFERQLLSGLFCKIADDLLIKHAIVTPVQALNDLCELANMAGNLVWIQDDFHKQKSARFNKANTPFDDAIIRYLNACAPEFKKTLQLWKNGLAANPNTCQALKVFCQELEQSPFCIGGWDALKGREWYRYD